MSVNHDCLDITVVTEKSVKTEAFSLPLAALVANGRLFIRNNRGEMEQVLSMTYWKDDDLLTVSARTGEECNDDGEVVRSWR